MKGKMNLPLKEFLTLVGPAQVLHIIEEGETEPAFKDRSVKIRDHEELLDREVKFIQPAADTENAGKVYLQDLDLSGGRMITVKDFLEKITNPDRIKIVKGEEVLFAGYKGALVHEGAADLSPDILEAEMVSFRIDPEIRAKDWKARGLMAPIEPEQAPDYKFSDLEMKLYYKICI